MPRYVKIGLFYLYQLYFCQLCSRELHKVGKYGLTISSSLRLGPQAVALAKNTGESYREGDFQTLCWVKHQRKISQFVNFAKFLQIICNSSAKNFKSKSFDVSYWARRKNQYFSLYEINKYEGYSKILSKCIFDKKLCIFFAFLKLCRYFYFRWHYKMCYM